MNQIDLLGLLTYEEALTEGSDLARENTKNSVQPGKGPNSRREYCGLICKCNDDYKYTPPHPGDKPPMVRILHGTRFIWVAAEQPGGAGAYGCDPYLNADTNEAVSCEKAFGKEWSEVSAYHSHIHDTGFSSQDEEFVESTGLPLGKINPNNQIDLLVPGSPSPTSIPIRPAS